MAGDTDSRADSKGRRGTREVLEWARGGILKSLLIEKLGDVDWQHLLDLLLGCSAGDELSRDESQIVKMCEGNLAANSRSRVLASTLSFGRCGWGPTHSRPCPTEKKKTSENLRCRPTQGRSRNPEHQSDGLHHLFRQPTTTNPNPPATGRSHDSRWVTHTERERAPAYVQPERFANLDGVGHETDDVKFSMPSAGTSARRV